MLFLLCFQTIFLENSTSLELLYRWLYLHCLLFLVPPINAHVVKTWSLRDYNTYVIITWYWSLEARVYWSVVCEYSIMVAVETWKYYYHFSIFVCFLIILVRHLPDLPDQLRCLCTRSAPIIISTTNISSLPAKPAKTSTTHYMLTMIRPVCWKLLKLSLVQSPKHEVQVI